jgi:type IV pilus assembly protein PilF
LNRLIAIVVLAVAAGCSSQTTLESRPVTDSGGGADARRRAEVHTALAGEYYARGNFAVAIAETRLALKDDPTYYNAYNMQALIYMELREDVQAREAFGTALRLSPNNPEVLNNYGWFLCLRNEPRGLEMIFKAATDSLYATPEKAWLSAGLCLRRQGRNAEAEDVMRRAVLIKPELIGALYNLALITYERGAVKEAETYLNRYTRLSTPTLDALVLGVRIARANQDKSGEDSFMQQLRRRYPDSPQLRELEGR